MMFTFFGTFLLSMGLPGAAELSRERCNTTADRLHIIVGSSSQMELTFKRINNFYQFFHSKGDNISHSRLTVIEPFQEIVWTSTVYISSQEILDGLDRFQRLITLNTSTSLDISKIPSAIHFKNKTLQKTSPIDADKFSDVIAWFSDCYGDCKITFELFGSYKTHFWGKQLFLFLMSRYKPSTRLIYDDAKFIGVISDFNGEHNDGNEISTRVCQQCPIGWIMFSYAYEPSLNSCYKIMVFSRKQSWLDASKRCSEISAYLPVLETKEELNFLVRTFVNFHQSINSDHSKLRVYLGLTQINSGTEIFKWSNERPFVLQHNIEYKNSEEKCVILRYSVDRIKSDELFDENEVIQWELVDCTKTNTDIVLCERPKGELLDTELAQFMPGWRNVLKRMKTLNKEFTVKIDRGEMYSVVNREVDTGHDTLNELKDLLFDCEDGFQFVVYSKVCNDVKDCANGRDESYCKTSSYIVSMSFLFCCTNPNANEGFQLTQFLLLESKCNLIQECPDNSDEEGCDECMERRCSNGACVPWDWSLRGSGECIFNLTDYRATSINKSVQNAYLKSNQPFEAVFCNLNKFPEQLLMPGQREKHKWAPKCLYLRGRGGQTMGCDDMSHLQDCEHFECPEYFIKCFHSYCIPSYLAMDGQLDCPYGEDESLSHNKNGSFVCNSKYNKQIYIHPAQVCDGFAHCPQKDDELNCHVTCPPGFKCFGSAVMVDDHHQVLEVKSFRMFDINTKFLNLSGLDLSMLNELYILPYLLELYISNCSLQSLDFIISKEIIQPLFKIDLSSNDITAIHQRSSDDVILPSLAFLNISKNSNLSNLSRVWYNAGKITKLDLSFTQISTLDSVFSRHFISLRHLYVANTNIQNLNFLNQTSTLVCLDIRKTPLSGTEIASALTKLTISSAFYTDNFKHCCPQVVGNGIPKHVCHAPFDGISSCEDLIGDIIQRSLLWLVATFSLLGNAIVLIFRFIYELGGVKKGYVIFVTNLGIYDLIMGVYLTIIASVDIYFRDIYVFHETEWRFSALCKISGFLSTLSSETSNFFVLLITLDRFLVIRFSFGEYRLKKSIVTLSALTSWAIGLMLALIPIVYPQWRICSSNGMCLGLRLTTGRQDGWHYAVGIFIMFNFILFLLIAIGQILIFQSMSSQRITMNTVNLSRREQDINVAKQLFIVALSNFLCWFLICVTGLMALNGHKVSPDTNAWFVIFVLPLNAALNPLIYTIPAIYKQWIEFKRARLS